MVSKSFLKRSCIVHAFENVPKDILYERSMQKVNKSDTFYIEKRTSRKYIQEKEKLNRSCSGVVSI